jgi:hypothetical protein
MTGFTSNINEINVCIEPYIFIDVISGTTKYTGTSASFTNINTPNWRIKKEWTCGTVTYMGFPNGSQDFKFIWNCRCTYTYL